MANVKCRIYNEGEKVFANFEFDNIYIARDYFLDSDNFKDVANALSEELESEEETEEAKDFGSAKAQARASLAETLGKLPKEIIEDLADLLQEVSTKNN
jgi:hypothetical protein